MFKSINLKRWYYVGNNSTYGCVVLFLFPSLSKILLIWLELLLLWYFFNFIENWLFSGINFGTFDLYILHLADKLIHVSRKLISRLDNIRKGFDLSLLSSYLLGDVKNRRVLIHSFEFIYGLCDAVVFGAKEE